LCKKEKPVSEDLPFGCLVVFAIVFVLFMFLIGAGGILVQILKWGLAIWLGGVIIELAPV
jgi:hypothetical protein